jgi:hypothetical protein
MLVTPPAMARRFSTVIRMSIYPLAKAPGQRARKGQRLRKASSTIYDADAVLAKDSRTPHRSQEKMR